jgi:CheY-like chemotaxis protein
VPQTVLIVEDEPLALASISSFLRDHGYRIVQATDGSEALKLLESKLKIDMVLSDIALPGIDGYQVLQRVRYRLPGTPVILMSGNFTGPAWESDLPVSAKARGSGLDHRFAQLCLHSAAVG